MRLLLELMLVHVAYATSQPSLARVAAVRLCTPALRVALQPRSRSVPGTANSQLFTLNSSLPRRSVPVSGNLTEEPSACHEIVLYKSNTFCYTSIMKSEIAGTLVEWDENKNQLNIRKHGIIEKRLYAYNFSKSSNLVRKEDLLWRGMRILFRL